MKMYELQDKLFYYLCKLNFYAHEQGYFLTLGRGREDKETNSRHGGKPNSLHLVGLAQDLNFFKNGIYLTKTEDLKLFGDWWMAQGEEFAWGGTFSTPDGNHFSIRFQGRA